MTPSPSRKSPPVSSPLFALCVLSIAVALHGATNVAKSLWNADSEPNVIMWNNEFCLWRMHDTCWASPNVTLASYELLFPVTRDALFQRGIVQRFPPLETRYDVAVVWNAMARCREIHQRLEISPLDSERVVLFESLPSNVSVDAWCGASQLGHIEDGEEPQSVVWLLQGDATTSPFTAHKAVFLEEMTTCDRREQTRMLVEGMGALTLSLAVFLGRARLVACFSWLRTKAVCGKSRSLVVNPRVVKHTIPAPTPSTKMDESVDPTWIDL